MTRVILFEIEQDRYRQVWEGGRTTCVMRDRNDYVAHAGRLPPVVTRTPEESGAVAHQVADPAAEGAWVSAIGRFAAWGKVSCFSE